MTRHLLSIVIIAFFGYMMARLAADHVAPMIRYGDTTTVSGAQLSDTWNGIDEWTRLKFNGIPIGAMRQFVTQTPKGYHASIEGHIDRGPLDLELQSSALMDTRLQLEQFRMKIDGGDIHVELAGLVENLNLHLKLSSPSGTRFTTIRLQDPITLNIASDALMKSALLGPGESYMMDIYDPMWGMQAGKMRVSMVGEETITIDGTPMAALRVESAMSNIRMTVWLHPETREPLLREVAFVPSRRGRDGDAGTARSAFTLSMEVIPMDRQQDEQYAELISPVPPPDLEREDLRGEDTGDPMNAFGLLPMLLRSQGSSFGLPGLNLTEDANASDQ